MAGSQAYQVNFGGFVDPMRNVNDAVSGLQGAISNYGANQDKRDDRSLQALRALNKINTENEKSRILQDINENPNEFNQVLADKQGLALSKKYDDIYNSLYEKNPLYKDGSDVEEYIPRAGKTDADNKILKDRRDRFDHGFLGVAEGQDTPLGIQTLTDNYGKAPRTAEDMSNDVYNQMLAKGYSIDDAEKARKTQLAKGAVAGPSKGILDMLKAKADIRSKLGSKQADMLAQDGLINRMTTVSDKVSNYKNSKGKLKSPSSKTLEKVTTGIDPNSGIMGFLTGGIGADKGNYVISQLVNDGYSLNQINEMMKSQEVGEWFGSQNEYDAHTSEGLYENVLNYAKSKGWNPGTPGSATGNGGKSGSQTTYDKHYVKGTGDKVNSAFNRTLNDINKMYADAGVGKSNNNPLLTNSMINDVFTLGDQKVNYADSKSNGSTKTDPKEIKYPKEITTDKDIIEKYRNNPKNPLLKSDSKKTKRNPLGLSNSDIDVLNYEHNRDDANAVDNGDYQPTFSSDPLGWLTRSHGPKGGSGQTPGSSMYNLPERTTNKKILENVSKGKENAIKALKKQYPRLSDVELELMLEETLRQDPTRNILK